MINLQLLNQAVIVTGHASQDATHEVNVPCMLVSYETEKFIERAFRKRSIEDKNLHLVANEHGVFMVSWTNPIRGYSMNLIDSLKEDLKYIEYLYPNDILIVKEE